MALSNERKQAEAVGWFLRQRDPVSADWDGFLAWLEQDPAHGPLYDAVALADGDYADLVEAAPAAEPVTLPIATPVPANDNRVRRWVAGVAAAVVATTGVLLYPSMMAPASYAVETGPGQRQSVMLDDGTRIELNGDSRITLHKGDARFASLDRGEAAFSVVHDPEHPFTVHVGSDQVQDVGTVFNIVRDGAMVETSVASGAVLYNPSGQALRVDAGHRLRNNGGDIALSTIVPTEVASWRSNRLIYKDATLSRVAADLSRNLGEPIRVQPEIADQRFTGVLMLQGDRAAIMPRISSLLDVSMKHESNGWRMSSRIRESH